MFTRPKCGKRKWAYLLNWWKRAGRLLGVCIVLFSLSLVCRLLRRRRRLLRFLVSWTVGSRVVSLIWESLAAFHWFTVVATSKYSRPFLGSSIKENISNTIESISLDLTYPTLLRQDSKHLTEDRIKEQLMLQSLLQSQFCLCLLKGCPFLEVCNFPLPLFMFPSVHFSLYLLFSPPCKDKMAASIRQRSSSLPLIFRQCALAPPQRLMPHAAAAAKI